MRSLFARLHRRYGKKIIGSRRQAMVSAKIRARSIGMEAALTRQTAPAPPEARPKVAIICAGFGGLMTGYMLMPQDVELKHTYTAEVTMNLPWLNKRKHDSEIAEARTMTEVTRAEYDMQRAAIFLEIQEALIRAKAARRNVELYRSTLMPQVEATFKAAAAAYQHDRTDFLNLVDSQNMMLDVRSAFYRSAADFDSRLAELERAIGTTLPERGVVLGGGK